MHTADYPVPTLQASVSRSATPAERSSPASATFVPRWFHALALAWVLAALAYAAFAPQRFPLFTAEDGILEWLTVSMFAAAGVVGARRAVIERRPFDLLVALFCLFVAGEEFSWGQRLFGYTPPEYFLENNGQQELNLHNMARPRKLFSAAMLGFGLILPLVWRLEAGRRVMRRLGASAPPVALLPWVLAAVLLTQWDPQKVTSEWAECLAGGIFLIALRRPAARRSLAPLGLAAATIALTAVSSLQRAGGAAYVRCASAELDALLADVSRGRAATPALHTAGAIDKQVWQAAGKGELDVERASAFQSAACADGDAASRRRYAVDPWGVSYWVAVREENGGRRVVIYSLGPNRRRDGAPGSGAGDDIARVADLRRPTSEVGGSVAR